MGANLKHFFCVILLLSLADNLHGQEYMYVNTDNLILRDRPEKVYNVFAILHAPCRLKIEPYEDGYRDDKAVTRKFYQVSISYADDDGIHHYTGGWVEKRYMVNDLDKVTLPGADKSAEIEASVVVMIPYMGDDEHNPNGGNAGAFQAPKYKGGEKQPPPYRKVYQLGPRGGCFYMNRKGNKEYVDPKFCKGVRK